MHRMFSFWVLVGILALVAVVFYRVMASFLLPLFLAALLAVIFQPLHLWALRRSGQRRYVAATIATLGVTLIVFVPLGWAVSLAVREGIVVANHFDSKRVANEVARWRVQLHLELPLKEDAADVGLRLRQLDRDLDQLEAAEPADESGEEPNAVTKLLKRQVADQIGELGRRAQEIQRLMPERDGADNASDAARVRESIGQWQIAVGGLSETFQTGNLAATRGELVETQQRFDAMVMLLPGGVWRVWARDMLEPSSVRWKELQARAISELQAVALPAANATLTIAVKFLFGTIIMFVSVFFFFADGHRMAETVMKLVPLDIRHQHELLDDFTCTSRAVVLATIVSAVVQGVLAGLGFWVAGVDSVMLLTILTIVLAMVPFVGALSVWAPVSIWMLIGEGRTWPAVGLAIYGGLVVSQADNFVKPYILKGQSNLHPLLALLSILGGVQAIGPVGIVLGPLVVVFLQTLLRILHREMTSFEAKEANEASAKGGETAQSA